MKKLLRIAAMTAVLIPTVPLVLTSTSGIANAAKSPGGGCACPVTQGTKTYDIAGVNCTGLPSDCPAGKLY